MTMSPDSRLVYQILIDSPNPLSAKQIGLQMGIVPNTVYRLTEELIKLGLITKSESSPHLFAAKSIPEGLSLFLLNQHNWFSETFTKSKLVPRRETIPRQTQQISISFIRSRDELMQLSIGETNRAIKSVDLLRSGHEIPADLLLAMRQSHKRHVVTRMLIQDYGPKNEEMVSYWKKNGIQVRKTELRHIRLMMYDSSIIYFMSYKHTDSEKDMGMEIEYPPFSAILSPLFNEWWQKAEKI